MMKSDNMINKIKSVICIGLSIVVGCCFLSSCNTKNDNKTDNEAMTDKLYDLRVDNINDPIGVDNPAPLFSWKAQSDRLGWKQAAYRLTVKNGEQTVWDSGRVNSDDSVAVAYEGQILQSSTEYDWTVEVWDNTGESTSASSSFETGLFQNELADASWIGVGESGSAETEYTIDFDFIIEANNQKFCFGMQDTGSFVMLQVNNGEHGEEVLLRPHVKTNGNWTAVPGQFDYTQE